MEKSTLGFRIPTYLAFCHVISSSINILFLKREQLLNKLKYFFKLFFVDGNRIIPTTPKPPQSAPAGPSAALLATLASQGGLASLIGGAGMTNSGSPSGIDLASLAKNPQILALLQARQQASSQGSTGAGLASLLGGGAGNTNSGSPGGGGGIDLAALLKNPQILSLLQQTSTTPAPKLSDLDVLLQDPKIVKILKEKLKSLPEPTEKPATAEVIPGIGALAESFPGGPQALQKVLNDPQVLKFITSNPDIVQGFIKNGLPDPDKLQTLLALAGPTPEGMYLFNIPVLHSEIFTVCTI